MMKKRPEMAAFFYENIEIVHINSEAKFWKIGFISIRQRKEGEMCDGKQKCVAESHCRRAYG